MCGTTMVHAACGAAICRMYHHIPQRAAQLKSQWDIARHARDHICIRLGAVRCLALCCVVLRRVAFRCARGFKMTIADLHSVDSNDAAMTLLNTTKGPTLSGP